MSIPNAFMLDEPVETFPCEEGFARVTRDGKTDIYVVQNQEYPGDYKVSLAFALDDFSPSDSNKTYGEPLILRSLDKIGYLGNAVDYFIPCAPLWETTFEVVRRTPESVGLLPAIRALEFLRSKGKKPTSTELTSATDYYLSDYHNRRALLIA